MDEIIILVIWKGNINTDKRVPYSIENLEKLKKLPYLTYVNDRLFTMTHNKEILKIFKPIVRQMNQQSFIDSINANNK